MHEMGIAQEIIEIVRSSIPADRADRRVETVNLKIGRLSAVVADSLRFCFDIAVKGTRLDGARLAILEIPVVARCKACGHQWTIEGPAFTCERCRDGNIELLSGRELDIESIEIADEDAQDAPSPH